MSTPDRSIDQMLATGVLRLREHMLNHAELIFNKVLTVAPDNPTALRWLGVTLCKLGRLHDGIPRLRAAVVSDPRPEVAWCDLAVGLRQAGETEAAEAARAQAAALCAQRPTPVSLLPLADLAFSSERDVHAFTVADDYPYKATIRHGAGRPSHPELAALICQGRDRYAAFLDEMGELQADFAEIALGGAYEGPEPFWLNGWFTALDAMALTQMLRRHDPPQMVEIGSGMSTKFARRAVSKYGLRTRLASIDPEPRNEVDALCDQVIRKPLEACDPAMFMGLGAGDILFLDSSHRAFQGSDVTVFFLEILPRLKPGVIVHIHDIYLPDDYISGHLWRLWNEQYMLATALLFGGPAFEIMFPCWYVGQDAGLVAQGRAGLCRGPLATLDLYGTSFWLRKT